MTTMLISTAQLAQHLTDPDWIIFDCRHDLMDAGKGERVYREGHIPGAYLANLDIDLSGEKTGRNGRHPLPSPAAFTAFFARHGVTNTSTIVAYDDVGGQFASRLWWLARWIGLPSVLLLDGGIPKWIAEARTLSREVPVPMHIHNRIHDAIPQSAPLKAHADPHMVVSADEVKSRLGDTTAMLLIDARAAERYRGEMEPIDPVAGHIPGAYNRFYKENLNPDLTLRSVDDLHASFSQTLGTTPARRVVHQCGSGVTACANIFAMEYAGLEGSQLYAGSWSEWVSDPSRPVATGGEP